MYTIPRYLNKPISFLGLELDEVILIYIAGFYSYVAKSVPYFILLISATAWFIYKKRKSPQGYFKHSLYYIALFKLDSYPDYNQNEFLE